MSFLIGLPEKPGRFGGLAYLDLPSAEMTGQIV
jgi:hypothetical protein